MQSENLSSKVFAAAGLSVAIIIIGLVMSITACSRGEIEPTPTPTRQALNETALIFETIEQENGAGSKYNTVEPGIMVISSKEDITSLPSGSDEAIHKLQELDYENFFALIVFQGRKDSGGYDVQIERVAPVETTINVYAQFNEPKPNEVITLVATSPFHLVKIQKTGEWGQEFLFQVIVGDTIVATLNHFIP